MQRQEISCNPNRVDVCCKCKIKKDDMLQVDFDNLKSLNYCKTCEKKYFRCHNKENCSAEPIVIRNIYDDEYEKYFYYFLCDKHKKDKHSIDPVEEYYHKVREYKITGLFTLKESF